MGMGYPVRVKYADMRRTYLARMSTVSHDMVLLSPKLFTEMILEFCEIPTCDYRLGVSRIFLRHRAAQTLEMIQFDETQIAARVSAKIDVFLDAVRT